MAARRLAAEAWMTVFVVAQLRFINRRAYDRYQKKFMGVFAQFSGRLLASDEHPQVVEGDWHWTKFVILSSPDELSFRAWYDSLEYQEIARDRKAGAEELILLINGMADFPSGSDQR
jgi:uncharacterized protein (DUF1330 family)